MCMIDCRVRTGPEPAAGAPVSCMVSEVGLLGTSRHRLPGSALCSSLGHSLWTSETGSPKEHSS